MDTLFRWGKMHCMQKALFVLLSVVLVACSGEEKVNLPDEPETPEAEITLAEGTDKHPLLDASGGTVTLHFTSTADWKATVGNVRASSWITVSPTSGKAGEASVTISVAANDGTDERTASVFLDCGDSRETIVVTQKQKDALIVSRQSYELSAGESLIEVEVEANVTFEVEVSDTWIEQISTRSLEKSVLSFRILANDGYEKRSGSILVRSGELQEAVRIYQEGKEKEVLLLSEDMVEVGALGGTVDVQLQSSVSYICKPVTEYTWVSEITSRAVSTHTLHFAVQPNDTYDMREARFVFIDETESLSDTLTIRQYAADEILVPSDPIICEPESGTFSFEVSANISYDVTTDVSWLKQVVGRGMERSTLHFSVEENTGSAMREGNIILSGNGVERTVKVMQKGKEEAPYLIVSQEHFNILPEGGTVRFTVKANVPYRVNTDADWMVQAVSGSSDEIVFTVSANESTSSREATITVTSEDGSLVRTVQVVQKGEAVYLDVSPSFLSLTSSSQTISLQVETNTHYRLSSDASWLVCDMTGLGNWSNPSFTVSANELTSSREATITVTSEDGSLVRTVQVVQEGRDEVLLNVFPSFLSLTSNSQRISLQVETNTRYRLSSDASWLVCDMTGLGNWSNPSFTVSANELTSSREATITVTSEDGSLVRTVQVVQEGEAVYLDVSPSSLSLTSSSQTISLQVETNTHYRLSSDASWLVCDMTGLGNWSNPSFTVSVNESTSSREATITVTSEDGSLVRTVQVVQKGEAVYLDVSPSNISATAEGGKFTFTVNSNTQYTFTCSDNSWISVDGNLIVIGANTSTSQRKGNVTVRAAELVRVIEITQAGKKEETPSAGGSIEDFTENEEDW
ncbi:BACON domain-containing protein [Phocaeicola coprocola]|uniref:BACON domain-containing protein n=1 Tax=Phocaeicola coprocola TaxID=310298 RepID=UPI0026DC6ACF|nr:BACON domain-containing carbohydrate-binding protein [Phocaeicola coprocola]